MLWKYNNNQQLTTQGREINPLVSPRPANGYRWQENNGWQCRGQKLVGLEEEEFFQESLKLPVFNYPGEALRSLAYNRFLWTRSDAGLDLAAAAPVRGTARQLVSGPRPFRLCP